MFREISELSGLDLKGSMTSDKLQKNILSTYFTLRLGIVVLSAAFPLILYIGGKRAGVDLLSSMSSYYGDHDGLMRNWFVGILWTLGWFLYLYKGFSNLENIVLNTAGILAVAVAMIPCNCWDESIVEGNKLHAFAAVSFFLCMAFVCFFCAKDTVNLLPDVKIVDQFRRKYRVIGALLAASPVAAVLVSYAFDRHDSAKFFVEAFGVWVFGYYWWVKSREFRITSAEKLATHGKVENVKRVGLVRVDAKST